MNNTENSLYYDYYGFPKKMYEITFKSKGSPEIAAKVVDLLNKVNHVTLFV
jgi:4,5-DOPA dioxygenase extradiol